MAQVTACHADFWPTMYCLITAVVLIAIAAIVARRVIADARSCVLFCWRTSLIVGQQQEAIIRDEDRDLVTATTAVAAGGCYVELHSVSNMARISHLLLFAVGFLVTSTDASSKCAIQPDGLHAAVGFGGNPNRTWAWIEQNFKRLNKKMLNIMADGGSRW